MSTIKGFVQSENIEVRQANGRSVANFDINVTEGASYKEQQTGEYKNRAGWKPMFVRVEIWGTDDKVQQMTGNLKKGMLVAVTGDLGIKTHTYQDKEYNNVSILAYKVEVLTKANATN